MKNKPTIVIAILNWNNAQLLPNCITALHRQTYKNFTILVIDNNSSDASRQVLQKLQNTYPITVQLNDDNLGFSRAYNQFFAATTAEIILALNPDVILEANYLDVLATTFVQNSHVGIISGKLYKISLQNFLNLHLQKGILDSSGLFLDIFQCPKDRRGADIFHRNEEVFACCGAAMAIRKQVLEDIRYQEEYFDNDFFCYSEDIDLSWRARHHGWKILFVPAAIGYHIRGHSDLVYRKSNINQKIARQSIVNKNLLLLKNQKTAKILIVLPFVLGFELVRFAYLLWKSPSVCLWPIDFIKLVPKMLKKRRFIQSTCKEQPQNETKNIDNNL